LLQRLLSFYHLWLYGHIAPTVEEVLAHGLCVQALQVYVHDQNLVSVGFSHLDAPYPFVLNLPQSETERILTVALEKLGG
jgi:hypothetical protein